MTRYDTDICIIGGGISAALLAQRLTELRPGFRMVIVEAGQRAFDRENRASHRQRMLDYDENPWPGDFIADQVADGMISKTMVVGGSAMHWGGVCNRFSAEDLRLKSLYGLATDWPLEWPELERFYCDAERRLGVSGEPSPLPEDARSEPYPMPPMPLTWNLIQLKAWAEQSGIPFWSTPQAKNTQPYDGRSACLRCNTCEICPTGARYSPDYTFQRLLEAKAIDLHDGVLIRRLITEPGSSRIVAARGVRQARPGEDVEYRARMFVLAAGYCWSPHLLLLSANPQFPKGIANSSGLVGRYMAGHAFISAQIEIEAELYPGMNEQHSLISRQFFRCRPDQPFVRHDLRVWESAVGRRPRLRGDDGRVLLGDDLLADWRARTKRATARVRAYYDVHPDVTSAVSLSKTKKNRWGDPLPVVDHRIDAASASRRQATRDHIAGVFARLARAQGGRILTTSEGEYLDHPCGGCRMGTDASASVCDSHGRTHDHENLFVVGAATLPTAGCTNGTLTFAALTLRSAAAIAERGRD